MGKEDRKKKEITLSIRKPAIDTEGRMSYSESIRAWNVIRLKYEFIRNFPKMMERRANVHYKIVHYFTYEELLRIIKEMRDNGDPLPMLFFLRAVSAGTE